MLLVKVLFGVVAAVALGVAWATWRSRRRWLAAAATASDSFDVGRAENAAEHDRLIGTCLLVVAGVNAFLAAAL